MLWSNPGPRDPELRPGGSTANWVPMKQQEVGEMLLELHRVRETLLELHRMGSAGPGTGPQEQVPRAMPSLDVMQGLPWAPAPFSHTTLHPGTRAQHRGGRPAMHYLQLHHAVTLQQLPRHLGCRNALSCTDHNSKSQQRVSTREPLRCFRPPTAEVTERTQAAETKFTSSAGDRAKKTPSEP